MRDDLSEQCRLPSAHGTHHFGDTPPRDAAAQCRIEWGDASGPGRARRSRAHDHVVHLRPQVTESRGGADGERKGSKRMHRPNKYRKQRLRNRGAEGTKPSCRVAL